MKLFKGLLIWIISFQLHAGATPQMYADFNKALDGGVAPNVGDVYPFAGGKLTRNKDKSLTYVNDKDPSIRQVLKDESDLKKFAEKSSEVQKAWIDQYGVNALANKDDYKRNSKEISKLLSKQGAPNSSVVIQGSGATLFYDGNGNPRAVVMADGKAKSISEYIASREFDASVGARDSAGSENYVADGSSNIVPENSNGEVKISTTLKADGTVDILAGLTDVAGGEFNRSYNGISGTVPESDPLTDLEYNIKYLDLASQVWGVTEIGEKMCKPVSGEFAKSLVNWWVVLKNYLEAEKQRDALLKSRTNALKEKLFLTNGKDASDIQLEGYKVQIESLNIGIDSISGSSLYEGDKKASQVRATSRLAWREAVLAAIYQGIEDSKKEDTQAVQAYTNCSNGIENGLAIASNACDNSTKDCARTKVVTDAEGNSSVVPDPVPGSCELKAASCEMRDTDIPLLKRVSMTDLATLYFVNPIPSKEINERLVRILNVMKKQINVFFPKSPDSKYDWTTPMQACVEPLTKVVKSNGVICPANASEKDYDKSKFAHLGKSDDFMTEMNHYAVGENFPPSSAGYAELNRVYKTSLKEFTDDKKINDGTRSEEDLQNMAQRVMWKAFSVDSKYSQNFVAGKATNDGIKREDELAYAEHVMKRDHITDPVCSSSNCQPALPVVRASNISVVSSDEVVKNAKVFLSAMGISSGNNEDTAKFLSDKWNLIDLYFGQSNIRQMYFQYNEKLISSLILSDRAKLGKLLADRQKIIEAYKKLKDYLDNIKTMTAAGSGVANTGRGTIGVGGGTPRSGISENGSTKIDAGSGQKISAKNDLGKNGLTVSGSNSAMMNTNQMFSIPKVSNGLLTYGPDSNMNSGALSTDRTNQNYSVAQGKKIANSKANLDKMQIDYNRILKNNKNLDRQDQNSEQKMEELFASKMNPKMMSDSGAALLSSFGGGAGASLSGSVDNSATSLGSNSGNSQSKGSSRAADYGHSSDSYSSSGSYGSSGSSSRSSNRSSNSVHGKYASSAKGNSNQWASLSDDEKKLTEAIYARDHANKSKYETQEGDSLFDVITKAHIRNYQNLQK